jgi:predicted TIM-barrel fold metal-dependent hydrolase
MQFFRYATGGAPQWGIRRDDEVVPLADMREEITYQNLGHADSEVPPEDGRFSRFVELAAYDNVAVKVSEIPQFSNEPFPYEDMHDHVQWFVDTFGRERVAWGSDFPNVSDVATYGEELTWLEYTDGLSERDREWITGRSFRRLAGLA